MLTNFIYFSKIYEGKDTYFEVINLKPNSDYAFKLKIIKEEENLEEKIIEVKTLMAPVAILSDKSDYIAKGDIFENKDNLNDYEKNIIYNCSRLIYDEKNENILKYSNGKIKTKITHDPIDDAYYISIDLEPDYFLEFFEQYLKECKGNIIMPCHFIIKQLPTILIFNLLETSTVILNGRRIGGMIASSLIFYILYIGKSMNIEYNNIFQKKSGKNSLGVVTFGSPSFLTNLTVGIKMKNFTSYFYHIKEEHDYFPEIIDFISHDDLINNNIKKKK